MIMVFSCVTFYFPPTPL